MRGEELGSGAQTIMKAFETEAVRLADKGSARS